MELGDYKDAAQIASTCITKNAQKLAGRDDVIIGTSASMPWFKIDENGAIKLMITTIQNKKLSKQTTNEETENTISETTESEDNEE